MRCVSLSLFFFMLCLGRTFVCTVRNLFMYKVNRLSKQVDMAQNKTSYLSFASLLNLFYLCPIDFDQELVFSISS